MATKSLMSNLQKARTAAFTVVFIYATVESARGIVRFGSDAYGFIKEKATEKKLAKEIEQTEAAKVA